MAWPWEWKERYPALVGWIILSLSTRERVFPKATGWVRITIAAGTWTVSFGSFASGLGFVFSRPLLGSTLVLSGALLLGGRGAVLAVRQRNALDAPVGLNLTVDKGPTEGIDPNHTVLRAQFLNNGSAGHFSVRGDWYTTTNESMGAPRWWVCFLDNTEKEEYVGAGDTATLNLVVVPHDTFQPTVGEWTGDGVGHPIIPSEWPPTSTPGRLHRIHKPLDDSRIHLTIQGRDTGRAWEALFGFARVPTEPGGFVPELLWSLPIYSDNWDGVTL